MNRLFIRSEKNSQLGWDQKFVLKSDQVKTKPTLKMGSIALVNVHLHFHILDSENQRKVSELTKKKDELIVNSEKLNQTGSSLARLRELLTSEISVF